MTQFIPKDTHYKEKVRDSFSRQGVMNTIGVSVVSIEPGEVELEFSHSAALTQQHGFIHAGIVTTVMDSACGYAAYTLMPENASVLTIEFKTNLLAPAQGSKFFAVGKVKKPGRTISVCEGELFSLTEGEKKLVATMTCTLMCIQNREGITG